MKILKGIIVGIVSFGICIPIAYTISLTSASVTYSNYDVDHNGRVDMTDWTYEKLFLSGELTSNNLSVFDVDGNKIISEVDAKVILSYITHSH